MKIFWLLLLCLIFSCDRSQTQASKIDALLKRIIAKENLENNYYPLESESFLNFDRKKQIAKYKSLFENGKINLKKLASLDALDLSFCHVDDEILKSLSELTHLQKLSLRNCQVSDKGAKYLSKCTSLEELDLGTSLFGSDKSLEYLGKLTSLKVLNLDENDITDKELKHLGKLASLQKLSLRSCQISDKGIEYLSKWTSLIELNLSYCTKISDKGILYLSKLTSLQKLGLSARSNGAYSQPQISDQGVKHLKKLVSLKEIDLSWNYKITDVGMQSLAKLPLEKLNIQGSSVGDYGLKYLSKCTSLKKLNLTWCTRISDDGLKHLGTLNSLQTLYLCCLEISDHGLKHLSKLGSLNFLDLSRCLQINDNGLKILSDFSSLQTLSLRGRYSDLQKPNGKHQISNKGWKYLSKSSLRHLYIQELQVNKEALISLSKLAFLQTLSLSQSSTLATDLRHLSPLNSLQLLILDLSFSLNHPAVKKLKQMLPKLKIVVNWLC